MGSDSLTTGGPRELEAREDHVVCTSVFSVARQACGNVEKTLVQHCRKEFRGTSKFVLPQWL